ncbi:beta-amyrin 6-beta-monooxygenase-like [Silene latifolia]|uniref:beta-amyrin 6-beta-monooxygenase-like n=1 Tax=Silene latifolia TaxID=37657 RepID=UPI003D7732F7
MALFISLWLILAAIFLFGKLIVSRFKSSNIKTKLPPGNTGWPIIGESIAFASNPGKFILDRMTKHSSEIFKTSIAGEPMAVLCGPAGNKFLFSSDDKLMKPWWPKSVSKALLFESCYPSPLTEDNSFLKLDSIIHYVPIIDSTTKDHLNTNWIPYNEVKVHTLAKLFTFDLSCRLFINSSKDQLNTLAKPFFDVAKGIISAPVNFPGTPFNGAVKGGAIIKKNIVEIIRQLKMEIARRGDNSESLDILSKLLLASDKNGKFYSDEDIANKIIGYLLASFYTTSNALTFVLSHLADHPHVYDKVFKEQVEIAKTKAGELLNWADIQRMKYTWDVVCESMRVMPPAHGGFKEVLSDFSLAGFNVPKGWKAMWTVHSTNNNPNYFPNPEKFDPTRFEGKGSPPFTFVPFGGGPRMCAGQEYARIEILAFVHNVVTRFKLKKVNPNEKVMYNPDPIPIQGLLIYLQPHSG